MKDVLGIDLKPEVLPFSNIPAYLPPFLLSPRRAMTVAREAKTMTTYFPEVRDGIAYEGPDSRSSLAFRYYDRTAWSREKRWRST